METIFSVSNVLVLPLWLLMILAPTWIWTRRLMTSPLVVAPVALLYAVLVVPGLLALLPTLANPTLPAIQALLGTPEGATIAWVHFLAFDLFVGRWAYLDGRERLLPPALVSVTLLLILLVGPLGLLAYLALRALRPAPEAARAS